MTTCKVKYQLSNEAQERILIETGKKPNWVQEVEIDMADLTPEQRAELVYVSDGDLRYAINLSERDTTLKSYTPSGDYALKWRYWLTTSAGTRVKYDRILTEAEILAEVTAYAAQLRQVQPLAEAKVAEVKAEREAKAAKDEAMKAAADAIMEKADAIANDEAALRELFRSGDQEVWDYQAKYNDKSLATRFHDTYLQPFAEARKEAAKAKAEADRLAWIEQHGSKRLKLAVKHGHPVDRIYVLERAAIEWPGWEVDFYNEAGWNERTNPPLAELEVLEETSNATDLRVELVWLTEAPRSQPQDERYWEPDYDFEKGPALVVRNYHGYDLVQRL